MDSRSTEGINETQLRDSLALVLNALSSGLLPGLVGSRTSPREGPEAAPASTDHQAPPIVHRYQSPRTSTTSAPSSVPQPFASLSTTTRLPPALPSLPPTPSLSSSRLAGTHPVLGPGTTHQPFVGMSSLSPILRTSNVNQARRLSSATTMPWSQPLPRRQSRRTRGPSSNPPTLSQSSVSSIGHCEVPGVVPRTLRVTIKVYPPQVSTMPSRLLK